MSDDAEQEGRARARIGTTVRGKYHLDAILGMGGMAVVYAATHRNQAEFAVKMLHPELSLNTDLRTRFLREGYAANSVKHPGVVQVVDDDVAEDGAAFLVMERLHGAGVDSVWETNGGVPASEAMGIVDQLLEVLGAAHEKNIVHRDIKPANLFLTRDGTVKVLDFGIARARDALMTGSGATGTGTLMGTPAFMAPEQALAKMSEIDGRTDLWAAGATLFTLVAGVFVHEGENAPQLLVQAATAPARSLGSLVPGAHPAIIEFVARSLAFEKEKRFPTAAAMQAALREAHQTAFGGPPPRQSLAALLPKTTSAPAAAFPPSPAVTGSEPPRDPPSPTPWTGPGNPPAAAVSRLAPMTTAHSVASERAPAAAPTRSSAPLWIAVGVVGLVVVGGLFAIPKLMGSHGAASPVVASALPTPSDEVVKPFAPANSPTSAPAPSETVPVVAMSSLPHAATAGPKPTAAAASASASHARPKPSAKPNCNPNFYFENGVKHFKEECL